jgi:flagella basal body P-ring formation protein FlgA
MRTLMRFSLLSAMLAGTAAADLIVKEVSRLRLQPQAFVRGDSVTLADVLDFTRADPRLLPEIGHEVLISGLTPPAETAVTHDQVVGRLDELGVNLARVLVSGALSCHLKLQPPIKDHAPNTATPGAPLIRARSRQHGATTLADALRGRIADELASAGGTIEVEFERASAEFLELTTPPFEFSIRGQRGPKLGLREFHVTLYRDGRAQRTVRVGVRVKLVKQVLVAARPLNVGRYIRRDSLEYARRIFSAGDDLGIDHAEQVIGQRVKQFVPAGEMIRESDLALVDLVKRSQPVTVTGGDSISVRITGDALDSGGYGDTIRVRLGDSRRNRREVRAIVTGVGTARLVNGEL